MNQPEKITSRDNQHLAAARRVRDGRGESSIFIEGRRLVDEALRSKLVIESAFCTGGIIDDELCQRIGATGAAVYEVGDKAFASIADTSTPQGIVLVAKRPVGGRELIEANVDARTGLRLVVLLNEINNPANLGAILRTAEAAGVAGVIVSTGSADVHSPKSTRAAMGASFRVAVWDGVAYDEAIGWARQRELSTIAADISATTAYTDVDWAKGGMLIFGSEAHGLSVAELASVDQKIIIPMSDAVESLNLAVSAGIILFEARRQCG